MICNIIRCYLAIHIKKSILGGQGGGGGGYGGGGGGGGNWSGPPGARSKCHYFSY